MRGIGGTHSGSDVESDIESHLPPPPPPCPPSFARANMLRTVALTRVSQSEPHLDIPHFVHGQDAQHVSSLTRVLSGLIQVDSALSTPFSRSQRAIDRQPVAVDDSALTKVKTKVVDSEYSSSDQTSRPLCPPLRKSSSSIAVNWSGIGQSLSEAPASSLQQLTPSFHQDSSGPTMSAVSSHDSTSLSNAVAKAFNANEPIVSDTPGTDVVGRSSPSTSHENTIDERHAHAHAHAHHNRGVLGLFGRGFFAKAVIRSEEENYRYLMALDR